MRDGVLVVDKPRGPTSHDVVARVRKALGTRAVGHAGTLDPMATGVLVVAVGEATKLVPYLTADEKEYEATVRLGAETDTLDAEGRVTRQVPPPPGWREVLPAALEAERARSAQVPPAYSAIHAGGVRAHQLARRGEAPELAPREVAARAIELLGTEDDEVRVRLVVAKGYYVRAFARDLAARLGTVGHLVALRRLRSGAFSLADASPLEPPPPLVPLHLAAARVLPVATLTERGVAHARVGKPVDPADLAPTAPGVHAWVDAGGRLVALGELTEGVGRVVRGFRG